MTHEIRTDPDALWLRLQTFADPTGQALLTDAWRLASKAHREQTRRVLTGQMPVPYIVHPLRVALIVAEEWEHRDTRTLATCLLHDVIEDAPARFQQEIETAMGKEIANAVWTLSKPNLPRPCPDDVRAARDARYFSALRHAADWVRLIKCADRVDNLRDARIWGDLPFWTRYSSETIGWHLYLARETSPVAEVALFDALVAGEREIRGRTPVWADGRLIDPVAAALIPESLARRHGVVGLALRGDTLLVGMRDMNDRAALEAVAQQTQKRLEAVPVSPDALEDAFGAGLYGGGPA